MIADLTLSHSIFKVSQIKVGQGTIQVLRLHVFTFFRPTHLISRRQHFFISAIPHTHRNNYYLEVASSILVYNSILNSFGKRSQ
jgi:hypothetical protein